MRPLKIPVCVGHNNNVIMPVNEEPTEPLNPTLQNYIFKVFNNLNALRINKHLCDVEIIAGDKIFQAHRAILAASSHYFDAMFTGGLCEKDQHSVEVHGIPSHLFEILLNFMYSGKIKINQNNVQGLMIASDMLGLNEVIAECTDFLIQEMNPLNAVGIYNFATSHSWTNLKLSAKQYIETCFLEICNEDEIYELDKDELGVFLSSEYLKIESEFEVFQAAIRWINYDILERRQYVFEILRNVRLPLISSSMLEKAISECNDSSLRIALKSIHSDLVNQKGCLVLLDVSPRKCAKKDIYVIGGSKRELNSVWDRGLEMDYVFIEKYNGCRREWTKLPGGKVNRLVPGVAALNGQIYLVGGEEDSVILASCECYDPEEHKWTRVASMLTTRCEFGLCALDGYLYAMGGWVDKDICGTIERYDPKLDQWDLVGELPESRFSMGIVAYKGLIYMVGGCSNDQRILKDFMSYNPITDEWKQLPSMSIARFQVGVAILNDYLYVVGGTNRKEEFNVVERYSFKTNEWSFAPPMKVERCGAAVATMDGLLYVIGGAQTHTTAFYRAQCTISSVECFEAYTNTWLECPPLLETRAEAGAVVI